ncbi:cysteine desulfurase family protein [Stappia sp. TSB10GB4]|uniref:cysteine desulfurase family protein n=1 Tax=Stappia sp. TSB10GB4 TaxID=2003584 RepID=UPI0016491533|nr:cysteine desulfurase family protein [Stappia sp. TSB10GB4]
MRVGNTIYLDHQATTPTDRRVLEQMMPFFADAFGNPHSADHILGWNAAQAIEAAASNVAALIGADSDEIVFTSGATEANNLALLGLAQSAVNGKRNRILVSATEHKSVLATAREIQRRLGFTVELLPVDVEGALSLKALKDKLSDDVLLVSIALINNEIGTISDITIIHELLTEFGAVFHCDCAQAPGVVDLKMLSEHVDMASLSGHKMYGPKGIGALFVRHSLQDRLHPIIHGGGQQRYLRSGTLPTPLCVGMGAAAEIARSTVAEVTPVLRRRRDRLVNGLGRLRWRTALNGPDLANRHPGNANVRFDGFSASDILAALQPKLAASTGSACTSGIPEPSHVLRAIGLSAAQAEASIRFSVGRQTTDQDIEDAIDLIDRALSKLVSGGMEVAV